MAGLESIHQGVGLLALECILRLERGETRRALESTLAGFRIARSLQGEPSLICHLVRAACDRKTLLVLERLLNLASLTDTQLATVDEALRLAECPDGLLLSMVSERAIAVDFFNRTAISSDYAASGLLDLDMLSCLEYYERVIDVASLPTHQQAAKFAAAESWLTALPAWRTRVTSVVTMNAGRAATIFAEHLACVRAT